MEGKVRKSTGSWYEVFTENDVYECRLRGKFKLLDLHVTNPVAVGDNVIFEQDEKHENKGIINKILPRENYIIRTSTHNANAAHMIASNIDQAVLIATLKMPRTSLGFIDRFLVTCETFRIRAVVVFNKADLLNKKELAYFDEVSDMYDHLGYQCMLTSAKEEKGINDLKELLSNKISLISGHSGVGKSTILNKLAPEISQKTAEISNYANKGVHTTTFAEMFKIGENTFVIDTPGIKELGLVGIEPEELNHYFPELRHGLGKCRYNNCTHVHEPGCVILPLLKEGKIALSRYESYLSMLFNEDNRR